MGSSGFSRELISRGATSAQKGQWIWRTSPQTWQRATPDALSISRKLVQPLVLQ
jgi:hypothetical protein